MTDPQPPSPAEPMSAKLPRLAEAVRQRDIMRSIIIDIGAALGVVGSPDGHEYVIAVRALMDGRKMPHYQMVEERRDAADATMANFCRPRPEAEWHEDFGDVLWWKFPLAEAPYSGNPNSSDWPGHHTHWTPMPPVWDLSKVDPNWKALIAELLPPDPAIALRTERDAARAELVEVRKVGVEAIDALAKTVDERDTALARVTALEQDDAVLEYRLWQIVDRDGPSGLPSDIEAAVTVLRDRAANAAPARAQVTELCAHVEALAGHGHTLGTPEEDAALDAVDRIRGAGAGEVKP